MKTKTQTLNFLLEDRIKLATVSGILTTRPNLIRLVDRDYPDIELITTKSYQVKPNKGNREPIIVEHGTGCFGNAVGLKNPGMEQGYEELKTLRETHDFRSYLNVSLSADSIDGFMVLIDRFQDVADILELNFSCPHAAKGFGASIGADRDVVAEYMKQLRKASAALLFPKLTPNIDNIGEIAQAAMDNGADGIAAINTVGPIVFVEPRTGKPVLYNPKGHKGGKSGAWITEVAVDRIKDIREAIGPGIPIIGMGGITTAHDVRRMREAGADVIGLGSVLARVKPEDRADFVASLKHEASLKHDTEGDIHRAERFVSTKRLMEYKPYKIQSIDDVNERLRVISLAGRIDYDPGEFVFLWIPDVGEKPFSIAHNDPLTFIVRKKGDFTQAVFDLRQGQELMIRGVYGAEAPGTGKQNVYVVAGGTGIAVVPGLLEKLHGHGKSIVVYYGVSCEEEAVFRERIERFATYIPVADDVAVGDDSAVADDVAIGDDAAVGRVLRVMEEDLNGKDLKDACFYNIGPEPLMKKAMDLQVEMGVDPKDIYASIETNNMCGVGMCGECECGGRLTCQEGTFFSLSYLKMKNIDIMDLKHD